MMDEVQAIQFDLWKEREGVKSLTLSRFLILDAFYSEIPDIAPRHIRRLTQKLRAFKADCQAIGELLPGPERAFQRWFAGEAIKVMRLDEMENVKQLNELKILLRMAQARKSQAPDPITGALPPVVGVTDAKIEQAKQTPILAMYAFVKLRRYGVKHMACCPFHDERSPSFYIYDNNTFHCFGCQVNGSAIDFYMRLNNCDFKSAVLSLTN